MSSTADLKKSKSIDKYLDPASGGKGHQASRGLSFPAADDADDLDDLKEQKEIVDDEAALLGYETAAPTVATSGGSSAAGRRPRRSSMKGGSGAGVNRRASIGYSGEMTLVLPMKQEVKKRTSITFDEGKNQINQVESAANLTDDPNRLWFQAEEYSHIREKVYAIVNRVESDKNSMLCTRGLEPLLDQKQSVMERKDAYDSVLEEQQSQRNQGKYNGESLAQMYSFHTIDSKVQAKQRADQDQKEIENYVASTRRMMRRLSC